MRLQYLVPALSAGVVLFLTGARADNPTVVTLGSLKSAAPADWKSQKPSNKFRAYQFAVGNAELTIFFFGEGSGGKAADNVTRWKSQFAAPAGKTIEDVSKVEKFKVGPVDITYLDIHGTFLSRFPPFDPNAKIERKDNYRRLGVYFGSEGGPYFITLTGPAATVEQHKKAFDGWLKNFK